MVGEQNANAIKKGIKTLANSYDKWHEHELLGRELEEVIL